MKHKQYNLKYIRRLGNLRSTDVTEKRGIKMGQFKPRKNITPHKVTQRKVYKYKYNKSIESKN